MKLNQIKVGETYRCKVSGKWVRVTVDEIVDFYDYKDRLTHHIRCTNLATGRKIVCRSPRRLRPDVSLNNAVAAEAANGDYPAMPGDPAEGPPQAADDA